MPSHDAEIAVVGAGPYGLAAAGHLLAAGHRVQVFGVPMGYWEDNMPARMLLRSPWRASSIARPGGAFSLATYERRRSAPFQRPVPRADFVAYGRWYAREAVGAVDERRVTRVRARNGGFALELADGDSLSVRRAVLAPGLAAAQWQPNPFSRLPPGLVSHTADERDLSRFAGRRLLVVGGGQSAVESAVLACEEGADVRL